MAGMVRTTAYAYPWDLARLGPERVLDDMAAQGIAAIDLAATYHPIDALSPRDGRVHLFSSPRGAVHFPARLQRYGRITPSFAPDDTIRAVWPAVDRAASSRGVGLNTWTVLLFQPWIADAYPDCARVLPSGDAVGSVVCQASEDVQEYFSLLCADVVDQFGIGTLRLEMASPPTYDYGWLRPRVLVELPPLARQLLAVCFCRSCVRRGSGAGIDIERVRRTVEAAIDEEVGGAGGPASSERAARLAGDPEVHEFVVQHERAMVDLLRATCSRVDAARRPRLSSIVNTPYELLLGDAQRGVVAEVLGAVDQTLIFPAGDEARARLVAEVAAASPRPVGLATFVVPVALGGLAGMPEVPGGEPDRVRRELRAASTFPLEEVNIYNYGLLRDGDVRSLVAAIGEELP
jgi:hypothetical protein